MAEGVEFCRKAWYDVGMKKMLSLLMSLLLLFGCAPIGTAPEPSAADAPDEAPKTVALEPSVSAEAFEIAVSEEPAAPAATGIPVPTEAPTATPEPTIAPTATPEPTATPDPNRKMVALTFDDGPNFHYTTYFLDVIEKYDVRVTFFLLGSAINDETGVLLQRMVDQGCELGVHGLNHDRMVYFNSHKNYVRLNATKKEISGWIEGGYESHLMRPPGGMQNEDVRSGARQAEMAVVKWSVDSADWKTRNKTEILKVCYEKIQDGSIVLFHDRLQSTLDAIDELIPWLLEQGYELVTVSELLESTGNPIRYGKLYYSRKDAE